MQMYKSRCAADTVRTNSFLYEMEIRDVFFLLQGVKNDDSLFPDGSKIAYRQLLQELCCLRLSCTLDLARDVPWQRPLAGEGGPVCIVAKILCYWLYS